MGQKVNPNGLRLGINRDWSSHWHAEKKNFASFLKEDMTIRNYLEEALKKTDSPLSHIDIDRIKNNITVTIYTSRPGSVLGTDGANVKLLKATLAKLLKKDPKNINLVILEVTNPDLDAVLVAKDIAKQLEQRGSYRVVQKKAIQRVMKAGAKGCKTMTKGRIGGAEIARYEEYREGVLSLHTLKQPIDYAHVDAHTTYGVIGVKVWIALPDNYKELRERKPEDKRNNRRPFNRDNRRPFNKSSKPVAPQAVPTEGKDDDSKGE